MEYFCDRCGIKLVTITITYNPPYTYIVENNRVSFNKLICGNSLTSSHDDLSDQLCTSCYTEICRKYDKWRSMK